MRAQYNGIELDFFIRPGMVLDMNPIKDIWQGDDYHIKSLWKEHPDLKTILEVGGHIGIFATMAAVLWPDALIRTYETWEENYHLLVSHCAQFLNIRTFNLAVLGSDEKKAMFRLPHRSQGNTGDGRIDTSGMDNAHFDEGMIEVDACSILKALEGWESVDLMKLDCEGSEIPILERLRKEDLLGSVGWIRGEWHGGDKNLNRVKELLSPTHRMEHEEPRHSYGLFWAERK